MKRTIEDRYERTEDGQIVLDVSVQSVEHLYNDFDRTAPYLKKDLDQAFVDHLTDSVREIRDRDFVIRISLSQMPDEIVMERVRKSIRTFHTYLRDLELRAVAALLRRSSVLFVIGLVLLALAIEVTRRVSSDEGVLAGVFAQGLTIAAWVSLWEALANLFLEWHPHRQNIRLYGRIMNAPVVFRQFQQHAN
ncbi:MAG: hypothetical protein AMJ65_00230 [Phycisphaerae bacterium SG8_4]|nr:MAG: hypothetical protein AMJ65_00230 [Phycisphaerae bacterium SG8_4]